MGTKLFVGNIAYSATEDSLREVFSKYGEVVSVKIIIDRESGRSKGFGFVEFATPEAAKAALEGANGTEVDGRPLSVSEARPEAPRQDRGGYNRNAA